MKPAPPPRPPSLDRPYTEHSYMWDALYDPQQKRLFKGSHACLSKAPWTGNVQQWLNIPALAACHTGVQNLPLLILCDSEKQVPDLFEFWCLICEMGVTLLIPRGFTVWMG